VTDVQIIYERVAGIDVGKREVAVTVRVPGEGPGAVRVEVTRKFKTFYPVLAVMAAWLAEHGVTHVVMESTGVYWRPVFHALCEADADFEVLLVNAAHVKNVLLSDPPVDFVDLGPDFYDTRGGTQRAIRNHVHRLEGYGYTVTLTPAA
jgi:hypothetical protein